MRTARQARGASAESLAATYLEALGWRVIARNIQLGKDEIDIVAVDCGPPPEVVCVEVRSARSRLYGSPEERVDKRKVSNLYRAARALARSDVAATLGVGGMKVRVDLVVVDMRGREPEIRHLHRLEPA